MNGFDCKTSTASTVLSDTNVPSTHLANAALATLTTMGTQANGLQDLNFYANTSSSLVTDPLSADTLSNAELTAATELLPMGFFNLDQLAEMDLNAFTGSATSSFDLQTVSKQDAMTKVGSDLTTLYANYQTSTPFTTASLQIYDAQLNASRFEINQAGVLAQTDVVTIDAVASGDTELLLQDLQTLGIQNASSFGTVVSGQLSIAAIEQLSQLDSLQFARPSYQPLTNVGRVTSQADSAMRADIARSQFGVSGSGIAIGVLSDSFNNLSGAANDIASNDLPVNTVVFKDLPSGGTDEGRAMMQLIHDVAPGAALGFYTAFGGEAAFANGILALADAGAKIIVDDVGYFAEAMFQDGIIAQAVDTVTARGVSYFSSAGNSGRASYESGFNSSGIVLNGLGLAHDFNPGASVDIFQSVSVAVGGTLTLSFQWDSPFYSLNPNSGGSANDIDIYLIDASGQTILTKSDSDNRRGDPVEILQFQNNGQFGTNFNVLITNAGGANPGLMKYVSLSSGSINEYNTGSSTLYGHANAKGTIAVGAAPYFQTPPYGINPAQLESFSSAGGTRILFDANGNRLAQAEVRLKPTIVAPDGTNTTFFGRDIAQDADTFPNFFGTSAAAPHAAAVAALLLEANPYLTPAEIRRALESTALDMDDPATQGFDTGFDLASGYGLVQADRAVASVLAGNSLTAARNLGSLAGTQTMRDFVGNADPIDFYRFRLDTPSNFSLSLTKLTADADVFLLRDFNGNGAIEAGEVLTGSESSGINPEALNLKSLPTGTYYVAVQQFSGETNYTLSLAAASSARSQGSSTAVEDGLVTMWTDAVVL